MLAAFERLRTKGVVKPNAPGLARHPNEIMLVGCEQFLRAGGYDEAQVDEKMRHVVLVHEAEAEALGHADYFKPAMMFDTARADRFPRKVDTSLEEARRARPGPQSTNTKIIGSATPRIDHGDSMKPARDVL